MAEQTEDKELSSSAAYLEQQRDDFPLSETLQTLPPVVARGLIYLLAGFMFLSVVYSYFASVDVIIGTRATLAPEGNVKPVQADLPGVVTEILVEEGKEVKEGEELAIIESPEVATLLANIREAEIEFADARREHDEIVPKKIEHAQMQAKAAKEKIELLNRSRQLIQDRYQKELESFQLATQMQELEMQKQQELMSRMELTAKNTVSRFKLWTKELEASSALRQRGVVSELEFLSVQRGHEEAEDNVAKAQSMSREANQDSQILEMRFQATKNAHDKTISEIKQMLEEIELQIATARAESLNSENEVAILALETEQKLRRAEFKIKQATAIASLNLRGVDEKVLNDIASGKREATNRNVLVAPVDGRVANIEISSKGVTVSPGQTVLSVVPTGVALIAKIKVPDRDIGSLQVGHEVKFKFDAFPFVDYGILRGKVLKISQTAETDEGATEAYFRVKSSLDRDYFDGRGTERGKKFYLRPGMTATAEIVTDRKTILELVLKPFTEISGE